MTFDPNDKNIQDMEQAAEIDAANDEVENLYTKEVNSDQPEQPTTPNLEDLMAQYRAVSEDTSALEEAKKADKWEALAQAIAKGGAQIGAGLAGIGAGATVKPTQMQFDQPDTYRTAMAERSQKLSGLKEMVDKYQKIKERQEDIAIRKEQAERRKFESDRDYKLEKQQIAEAQKRSEAQDARKEKELEVKLAKQGLLSQELQTSIDLKKANINKVNQEIENAQSPEEKAKLEQQLKEHESALKQEELKLKSTLNAEKAASKKSPEAKYEKLNTEAKNKVGSIVSGFQALKMMEDAVDSGSGPNYINPDTPGIGTFISDTPYTAAERTLSEVVGRLQSGGAINEQEGKRFVAMGPRPGDSPEMVRQKIKNQYNFLYNKIAAYGIKPQELNDLDVGLNIPKFHFGKKEKVMKPQDQEALKWAKQNPDDPRSEKILKRLGM